MWPYRVSALVLAVLVAGCGKPPMQSAHGTLKLDGKPVGNCKVGFFPDAEEFNPDRHGFGYGITNDQGEFVIQHPQGDKGIWPGKYKVTFVAWVDRSGKPLPFTTKPSEVSGGVRNIFPDIYEAPSTTTERVTVGRGENDFTFDIKSK